MNKSREKLIPDRAFTHGGIFHADDVFSAALLKYLKPGIQIERGMKVPENYPGLVFDIGGGIYDHHRKEPERRENGIPYAAFGLLWRSFGTEILSEGEAKRFDREFVQRLDQNDNTGTPNEIARLIHDFNPTWEEGFEDQDERFLQLVDMAVLILDRKFRYIRAEQKAKDLIQEKLAETKGPVLYLERSLPWKEAVEGHDILYVVCPSLRGGYVVQAVQISLASKELKKPFPEEWRGKTPKELSKMTGIPTFRFCHQAGFLCNAGTLEDAKRIADMAVSIADGENTCCLL